MKKFWLYWRWYALPLASFAGALAALVAVVAARTAFDYARTLESPTPQSVAELPIMRRTAETLFGAAVNVALRLPIELQAEIPTLELVVDPEEFSLLGARSAKSTGLEVDGSVKIGARWTGIKVKLRGDNIFHWGSELRSYTLEFGRADAVRGQEQINLINPKDAAALSIPFGEHTGRRLGVLTPDTQPCRLMLNGENQGVYFCQQPTNDAWLRLAHKPAGGIYVGDFLIYGYGSNFDGALRLWDTPSLWKPETAGADVSGAALYELLGVWRDIVRAPAAANADAYARRLAQVADVDAFLRLWATQTWSDSLHQDEYHNWRLYLDPSDGRFRPIVWDTLRVWEGTPEAALDAPLPRPQLAMLRFPELNQRRYAILYEELVKPELEAGVSEAWARGYYDRTRMTMLSATGIDRMDWTPNALSWVHVDRLTALNEQKTNLQRIRAHARGIAQALEAVEIGERVCAAQGPHLRCNLVLRSRAAADLVAVVVAGERRPVAARAAPGGPVRLRPGQGAPARFYPHFVTEAEALPGRYRARVAGAVQSFALEGVAPSAEVRTVWRNALTGREHEFAFPVRAARQAQAPAGAAVYTFAASPVTQAPPRLLLGPGAVVLRSTLETEVGQTLEIAAGTRVRLGPGVSILARGLLLVRGTRSAPVVFERLEPKLAWGGLAVLGRSGAGSRLEGCRVSGGSVPRRGSFTGTGMVQIAHAPRVSIIGCELAGSTIGDEALLMSQTAELRIRDVRISDAERDCVDLEHATGRIERLTAAGCGNDALDLADSVVEVRGAVLGPASDKAVSVGEHSALWLAGTSLHESDVGLLVKDVAQVYLDPGVRFHANRLDVFGYRRAKSSERGGCVVSAVAADLNANLEDDSRLTRVDTLRDFATTWLTPGLEGPCWRR